MNSRVLSGWPVARRSEVAAWLRGAALDWIFVAKAAFAVLLTGWLAMRFELEQPGTAMMTAAIVIHPQSGMVLAKSFYRAIGTVVGSLAALALFAAFPQQRTVFMASMAVWIGLCVGGASLYRNFKSYGFVLAGYTAAIVALPAVDQPQNVFDGAVMRVSEVMLGILVAGVVSDVLLPQRLGDVMRDGIRAQFAHFIAFVRSSLTGALPRAELEQAHLRFVREVVQIENQRSSVVFEDAGVRVRSPRLRRFNHAFMAVSTSYQSLHHLLNRLQDEAHAPVRERLSQLTSDLAMALGPAGSEPRAAAETDALAARLGALRERIAERVPALRAGLRERADLLDFDTGAELVARIADELHDYTLAYAQLALPHRATALPEPIAFTRATDWLNAGFAAARATVTMLAMGWFWIASAWPEGAGAMIIATVFAGVMATFPDPLRAIRLTLLGFVLGVVAGLACVYGVLVRMDGYLLFAAGLLPFLLVGFYMVTRPALMAIGLGYVPTMLFTMQVRNPMRFDALASLNAGLGQIAGIACAGVAFMLFANASGSAWLLRRLLRRLRLQVVHAARAPLRNLLAQFESGSRDLAVQIVGYTRPGSDEARLLLAWSLTVQETGRAVIELREEIAAGAVAPARRAVTEQAVAALAELYVAPGHARYRQARAALSDAIDSAGDDARLLAHLHLLRLALLDTASAMALYADRPAEAEERPDAA
ncbi:MAG: FUSC family protein [Rhodanobacteraceae bacterium]|jgi:uncharacterized membrane protein YccC|nr:FUSC family protein [Rhodanobacteraceae bacterium]